MIKLFLILQALDFATTVIGIRMGLAEASPAIRVMMNLGGPIVGLIVSKVIALGLLGLCFWLHRPKVIRKINYFYIALVVWNTGLITLVLIGSGGLP